MSDLRRRKRHVCSGRLIGQTAGKTENTEAEKSKIAIKDIVIKNTAINKIAVKRIAIKGTAIKNIAIKETAIKNTAIKILQFKKIAVKRSVQKGCQ